MYNVPLELTGTFNTIMHCLPLPPREPEPFLHLPGGGGGGGLHVTEPAQNDGVYCHIRYFPPANAKVDSVFWNTISSLFMTAPYTSAPDG